MKYACFEDHCSTITATWEEYLWFWFKFFKNIRTKSVKLVDRILKRRNLSSIWAWTLPKIHLIKGIEVELRVLACSNRCQVTTRTTMSICLVTIYNDSFRRLCLLNGMIVQFMTLIEEFARGRVFFFENKGRFLRILPSFKHGFVVVRSSLFFDVFELFIASLEGRVLFRPLLVSARSDGGAGSRFGQLSNAFFAFHILLLNLFNYNTQ